MESGATLSNCGIDCQDVSSEGRDDMAVHPCPKECSLRCIAAFGQQYTDFQFPDGNYR